jgi:hypothetical protein
MNGLLGLAALKCPLNRLSPGLPRACSGPPRPTRWECGRSLSLEQYLGPDSGAPSGHKWGGRCGRTSNGKRIRVQEDVIRDCTRKTGAMPTSRYPSGQLPVTEKPELVRTGGKSEKTIPLGLRPTAYPLGDSLK